MKIDANVVLRIEDSSSIGRKLDEVLRLLHESKARERRMAGEIELIREKVARLTTVVDSNKALLVELTRLIRENANDPAALRAIADDIDAQATEIAEDVAANTPGAP